MRRIGSALKRLSRETKGATAVEFGLIMLPFFAVIFAILELGFVFFEGQMLQAGVNSAARQMMTGQMQGSSTPPTNAAQFVTNYLCPATGPRKVPTNFNCANLVVDVRPVANFAASDVSNDIYKGNSEFCPGAPGQTVVMRVTYPLAAIFPLDLFSPTQGVHSDVPGLAGRYHILMAESMFTEENYAVSYTPPSGC